MNIPESVFWQCERIVSFYLSGFTTLPQVVVAWWWSFKIKSFKVNFNSSVCKYFPCSVDSLMYCLDPPSGRRTHHPTCWECAHRQPLPKAHLFKRWPVSRDSPLSSLLKTRHPIFIFPTATTRFLLLLILLTFPPFPFQIYWCQSTSLKCPLN